MEGLTEGRIVHYVLPNGEHRPAIVVRVWRYHDPDVVDQDGAPLLNPRNGCSNLQVFMDADAEAKYNDEMLPVSWRTSVTYSGENEPGTWHWIEKE